MSSFELAKNFFLSGLSLMEEGQFSAAESQFKESLIYAPDRPSTLINLSVALINLEKFKEADEFLNRLIQLEPGNADAYFYLGLIAKNSSHYEQAISHLNKSTQINSGLFDAWLLKAEIFETQNSIINVLACYEALLQINPNFLGGWINKGSILSEQGRHHEAIACYEAALNIDPQSIDALSNYGATLSELGRHEEAIAIHSKALSLKPESAQLQFNQGNAYAKSNKFSEAIACYQQAITLEENYSDAYCALGSAWAENNEINQALIAFNKALLYNPKNAKAHSNKGAALHQQFQFEEAIAAYQRAIDIDPVDYKTWSNKGVSLRALKRLDESLIAYDKALKIRFDYAEAWSNKGITLNDLKRHEEALYAYDQAISFRPNYAEAWSNKGITLSDLKRYDEALLAYEKAVNINPNISLLPGTFLHTKMQICKWDGYQDDLKKLEKKLKNGENAIQPFPLLSLIEDPAIQMSVARLSVESTAPENPILGPIEHIKKHKRIRIGYFSADFRTHPIAFLTAGLFDHHDRAQFEIFAFSYGPDTKDAIRERIKNSTDHFLDVQEHSDKEIAELARSLDIDIAVDLTGATQLGRIGIFACRAAPIQINYLGYPGTSGANYFDYCIADSTLIPESEIQYYTEKIVFMPNSYQVNDDKRVIAKHQFTKKDFGLPEDVFVFCCFNNNYKITPDIFNSWMKILQNTTSVLWLFEDNAMAAQNIITEAKKQGISDVRIIFAKHIGPAEHLARQKLADLFLDTAPYNAHTTASDALWVGLPVLTREAKSFPGRVAASLLKAIGLPELITKTTQEYEDLAISLANDSSKLQQLKLKLASNLLTTPLFNTRLFTQSLEEAYCEMFKCSINGDSKKHIYI